MPRSAWNYLISDVVIIRRKVEVDFGVLGCRSHEAKKAMVFFARLEADELMSDAMVGLSIQLGRNDIPLFAAQVVKPRPLFKCWRTTSPSRISTLWPIAHSFS